MNEEVMTCNTAVDERTDTVIANEINYIKRKTCETVLSASVEIGRLLCEAKNKVQSGEWMKWLEINVNYSQSTANNLMRLYEEYGEKEQLGFFEENKIEIFGDISPSQALALIALPYEKRKEYVQTHDMSETSVRDINTEIKARKEAEERAAELENKLSCITAHTVEIQAKESEYISEIEELKKQLEDLNSAEQIGLSDEREAELAAEKESAVKAAKAEIKEKLEKKIKALQEKIDNAESEKESAVTAAKAETACEKENAYKEQIEKLSAEQSELKRKAQAASNGSIQRLSAYLELFQNAFGSVLTSLNELKKENNENYEKLHAGVNMVLEQMAKQL